MNVLTLNTISKPYTNLIIRNHCVLHSHTFFEFSICLDGSLTNIINGKTYQIEKGQVILFRPQDYHEFYTTKKHTTRDIYVPVEKMKGICDQIDPQLFETINKEPLVVFFKLSEFDIQTLENGLAFFNNAENYSKISLNIAHVNAVIQLLNLWQQNEIKLLNNTLPMWITVLTRQINSGSFFDKSIKELVETTNYSHGYVCREFKKLMGITLNDYVTEARFSYAKALLKNYDLAISQISEKLNYTSTSNFIIAFRKRFGIPPAQWRKQLNLATKK